MLSTAESLPSLSLANATEFSSEAVTIHPEAIELVRRSRLSPSTMNELNGKCAAKWAVGYLTPRDDDPWSPAGAGTLVHAGLEDFYGLDPTQRSQRRLYVLLQDQARQAVSRIRGSAEAAALSTWKHGRTPDYDLGEDPAPAPEPLGFTSEEVGADARPGRDVVGEAFVETDELAEHLWALACGIFDIEDPETVDPVGSEVSVGGVELGGVPVSGQIDRVDELDDGTVEVIDFKTGAKIRGVAGPYRHDYAWQMRVYALAYEAMTGRTVSSARIFFTRLGKEVSVGLSKPMRQKTLKELSTAWDRHDQYTTTGVFPTEASPLCGWCPLVNLCPAASEAGIGLSERAEVTPFSPRDQRMPSGAELVALESASASDFEESPAEDSGHSHTVNDTPTDGDDPAMTVRRDQLTGELPPYIAEGEDESGRVTFESNSWAANNLYRLFVEAERLVASSELTDDDDAEFVFELMVNTIASATEEHSGVANPQAGIFTRFKDTLVNYAWANNPANADDPVEWMESAISHLLTRAQIVEDTYFRLAFDTEEADKEAA